MVQHYLQTMTTFILNKRKKEKYKTVQKLSLVFLYLHELIFDIRLRGRQDDYKKIHKLNGASVCM